MKSTQHIQTLIQERERIKKSKPHFVVKAASFSDRVKERWRNSRGLHSPIRQKYRGKPALVKVGYGSPAGVRGLHSSGLEPVVVHTVKEIVAVDVSRQGAVIGSGVGAKKKLALLAAAAEKKVRILNVRDGAKVIAEIKKDFESRLHEKKEKLDSKSQKEEEKKKTAEKKRKEEEQKKAAEKNVDQGHEGHAPGHDHSSGRDATIEEQKEMIEKTITKRQ